MLGHSNLASYASKTDAGCSRAAAPDGDLRTSIFMYGIKVGQVLLTRTDITNRKSYINAARYAGIYADKSNSADHQ